MKKVVKSFDEYGLEEKMGVPAGIVKLADECGKFVSNSIIDNGIIDDQKFQKIFDVNESHGEFPVKRIDFRISHRVMKLSRNVVKIQGSYDSSTLTHGENVSFVIKVDSIIDGIYAVDYPTEMHKKFVKELTSLMYHEFLHAYEDFTRGEKNKFDKLIDSRDFLSSSIASAILDKNPNLHPVVNKLVWLIYATAGFESRARISQMYAFIKDVADPRDRETIIKNSRMWETATELSEFNAVAYHKDLLDLVNDDKSKVDEVIKSISNILSSNTIKLSELLISKIDNDKDVPVEQIKQIKNRIDDNVQHFSKKFTVTQFLNYWERKFHSEGNKAKKKLSKMVVI